MSESDTKSDEGGAAAPIHDASLRLDPRTLSSEEQDFARLMGFGDDAPAPGEASPARKSTSRKSPPPAVGTRAPVPLPEPLAEPDEPTGRETAAGPVDEIPPTAKAPERAAPTPVDAGPVVPGPDSPAPPPRDWEEIHPRASALGRQAALVERADRVVKLEASPTTAGAGIAPSITVAAPVLDVAPLRAQLRASEQRIAELEATASALAAALEEKSPSHAAATPDAAREQDAEALQLEIDRLAEERDRLDDALAAAHTACAEAEARAERLEAALRATREPHGPLPEGDRALRAEVLGLRRRLEESGAEIRQLREALDARATELAIAHAHRDDRQDEIDQQRAQIARLEHERSQQGERLDEALVRQRELLALVSRIQAENVELRSTQAALEETLEARDLEISAREEHLLVTRRGLAARDEQLIDAAERLEQARHRHELLEAELERARHGQGELEEKLLRREARIASLSKTLARIEEAIGRPTPERATLPSSASPGAEASQDTPAPIVRTEPPAPIAAAPGVSAALIRWRDEKVRTLAGEVTGTLGFLAARLAGHPARTTAAPLRIVSLAGARTEAEVELAAALEAAGVDAFTIHVLEADEANAATRREAIAAAGRSAAIRVAVEPVGGAAAADGADALLLADALWHQPQPGPLLDRLAARLRPEGVVLFADRLAGGALTLSDATCEKLAELWQVLPETWTATDAFAAPPCAGEDGGVPTPPADPLRALHARFRPQTTIAFGHLVDLAVGPARGAFVSASGASAEAFLTSIDALDESRSLAEALPPRHGVAVLVRREAGPLPDEPVVLGADWPDAAR